MSRWAQSLIVAVTCGVAALYLGVHAGDARRVQDAERALLSGRPAASLAALDGVDRAPADARAEVLRAHALGAMKDFRAADRAWRAAIRRAPNDWMLEFEYARLLIRAGRYADAVDHIDRARELNPRMRVTPFLAGAP